MKKVVVIGGGTGVFTVLTGLKDYPFELCAIVSMADDGGSTGLLREEFGTLPAGDIRRALIALSDSNKKVLSELFNFRFGEETSLKGHSMGNLLLTALEKITGDFGSAIAEAGDVLNIKGEVIPVTLTRTKLFATLSNGKVVEGETNIDIPKHDGTISIKNIFLKPNAKANPKALEAIKKADAIILGPGDVYTSILPNLVVEGIVSALKNTKAKIIYNVNIMTKFGETNGFLASDFVEKMEEYLGKNIIDCVTVNTEKPTGEIVKRYEKENVEFVKNDLKDSNIIAADFLREGMFLRHDPEKLAKVLSKIIE
ncbi:MAG: YvcK family protein [Candidatus Levybacteria bacterium]|nr:YvcK family protein [Candidatus Levybacteria bacterium]